MASLEHPSHRFRALAQPHRRDPGRVPDRDRPRGARERGLRRQAARGEDRPPDRHGHGEHDLGVERRLREGLRLRRELARRTSRRCARSRASRRRASSATSRSRAAAARAASSRSRARTTPEETCPPTPTRWTSTAIAALGVTLAAGRNFEPQRDPAADRDLRLGAAGDRHQGVREGVVPGRPEPGRQDLLRRPRASRSRSSASSSTCTAPGSAGTSSTTSCCSRASRTGRARHLPRADPNRAAATR